MTASSNTGQYFFDILKDTSEKSSKIFDAVLAGKWNQKYLNYLCSYRPLENLMRRDSEIETFLDYAVHGIKLWEDGAYSKKIPEDIFLNYVL